MSKRFTSTEKWDDPWFRKLPLEAKCFWDYICCTADNTGVWKIDWELASFKIGTPITSEIISVINQGKKRVIVHNDEILVIFGFIDYQIGDLFSEKLTNLQKSCITLLYKHVTEKSIPKELFFVTGSLPVAYGYKYKGKGKGKGKDKGSVKRIVKEPKTVLVTQAPLKDLYLSSVYLTKEEHAKLIQRFGQEGTDRRIYDLNNGICSKGYKYKSHYHTILSWEAKNERK